MSKSALIEAHYLPCIEFFCALDQYEKIRIEEFEHFQKQTYRNRTYLLGANNVLALTIPVVKGNSKTIMRDLKVDNNQRWLTEHWRSIKSAYGKAPFFEFFADHFSRAYSVTPSFLIDFNISLLTICLNLLQVQKTIDKTDTFQPDNKKGVIELRSMIIPKKKYSDRPFYSPIAYIQVFGKNFVPNLSVIDLLMNEGPNANAIIQRSKKSE